MTSEPGYGHAFVWCWLPNQTTPVVAGRLTAVDGQIVFNYGQSYLRRGDAFPLYEPELPLKSGVLPLLNGLTMPSCLRDAAPDAWGRRVIISRKFGARGKDIDAADLDELAYFLESGSDRIGALDFQLSATKYAARDGAAATLGELLTAADRIEKGIALTPELESALLHGSSIGGARPKAMIVSEDKKYIAKFSSLNDVFNVVKAEYVAMRLASEAGLNVAPVTLQRASGKDVLLVERFDRQKAAGGWRRRSMVSALTILELDEMMARYASYEDLATIIRHRFTKPKATLKEMFARIVFNVLCGNTDDHARNHAAFWDGEKLTLTPAYDICPQARSGGEGSQAMLITGDDRASKIAVCLEAARSFLIAHDEAAALVKHQIGVIQTRWAAICDEAKLSEVDRNLMWRRQFLNPFAFDEAPQEIVRLVA
jgi:serine/threonine-protein kinase HipA